MCFMGYTRFLIDLRLKTTGQLPCISGNQTRNGGSILGSIQFYVMEKLLFMLNFRKVTQILLFYQSSV